MRNMAIAVVIIGVLALLVILERLYPPQSTTPEEREAATRRVLVENLGENWADAKQGDLVEFSGYLYVIQDIWMTDIRLHRGLAGFNSERLDIRHHLPQRKPILFKEVTEGFEEATHRFRRQVAGLPQEKKVVEEETEPDPVQDKPNANPEPQEPRNSWAFCFYSLRLNFTI
jgi:hypothetical protein